MKMLFMLLMLFFRPNNEGSFTCKRAMEHLTPLGPWGQQLCYMAIVLDCMYDTIDGTCMDLN